MKNKKIKIISIFIIVITLFILIILNVHAENYSQNVSNSFNSSNRIKLEFYNIKKVYNNFDNTYLNVEQYNKIRINAYISSYNAKVDIWGYDNNNNSTYIISYTKKDLVIDIYSNNTINGQRFNESNVLQENLTLDNNNYYNIYWKYDPWTNYCTLNINAKIEQSLQPLSKTYNKTFLNGANNDTFLSVQINGQSSDNTTFDSIDTIKYDNTIVYQNNAWVNGYSSVLKYNYEMLQPNVTDLNSVQNIVTFSTSQVATYMSKTYNISFINGNNIGFSNVVVNGTTMSGNVFNSISKIYYDNTEVYNQGTWTTGYNNAFYYTYNMNVPSTTQINYDCNAIITFHTALLDNAYNNTYNVGAFINNNGYFDSITIIGTTNNGTTYNNVDTIYYGNILVYENNAFTNAYNNILSYYYGSNTPNVATVNEVQNVVTFTPQMMTMDNSVYDKLLQSYTGMLDIIEQTASTISSGQIILTIMCIAVPLVSFGIMLFGRLKGRDTDGKV